MSVLFPLLFLSLESKRETPPAAYFSQQAVSPPVRLAFHEGGDLKAAEWAQETASQLGHAPFFKPLFVGDIHPKAHEKGPVQVGDTVRLYATVRFKEVVNPKKIQAGLWTNIDSDDPNWWSFLPVPFTIYERHDEERTYRGFWDVQLTKPGVRKWTSVFSVRDIPHSDKWANEDGALTVSVPGQRVVAAPPLPPLPPGMPDHLGLEWRERLYGAAYGIQSNG